MGESYSAIGNLKYHEGSDNESLPNFSKRHHRPAEDTPMYLMDENMRSSYYAFQMFCTTRFGMFMCFLWALSFCCAIISAVLYILYDATIWLNPNILCIDYLRLCGMISGILLTSALIVSLAYCTKQLCCGRSRSRKSFAIACFGLLLFVLQFPFYPS